MTLIASIGFASFLLLLLQREHNGRMERLRWEEERRSLLDRIQHPEIRQVQDMMVYEPHEPPRDGAELAQVGLEVPEFVNVGGDN